MTIVRIDNTNWVSGLEAAGKTFDLIGPVKDKTGYKFKSLSKKEIPDLRFTNTTLSPKEHLFPQSEKILEYSLDNSDGSNTSMSMVEKKYLPKAIIGIRPCDAKANLILQMNFDTQDVKDPYWVKAYRTTTFVGLACDNPCSSCFCTTANSNPYGTEGLDVILVPQENDTYFAKVITKKGKEFINQAGWENLPQEPDSVFNKNRKYAEKKISSKISTDKLKNIESLALYGATFWDGISFACLNCGTCTFACPTCWCFDIQDEANKNFGVRLKNWDSCMFPIFTVHTTGHNPRETKTQRVRQRFMHKLKYFIDKYDQSIMCVGCGRCVKSCPVNIDIRKVCELMNNFKPEDACAVQRK